ncbi:MAG: hypothetical protein AB7K71_05340 [Polyangiaceae bacterium]
MRARHFACLLPAALAALACHKKPALDASNVPQAPQAAGPRSNEILVQPQPIWRREAPSFNGTGFFLKAGLHIVLVSSAHYLTNEINAVNFWSMQGEPLLQSRYSLWGYQDHGVDGAIQDFSQDLVVMGVPRLPRGYVALEADSNTYLPPGERVWFPNKREGSPGHERVEGRITEWDPGYIDVELDRPVDFHSQSGSPVLSVNSNKVVGVISRVGGNSRIRLTPFWVSSSFISAMSDRHMDGKLLATSNLLPDKGQKTVTPKFHWGNAKWPMITIRFRGTAATTVSKQTVEVSAPPGERIQVRGMAEDMALYSLNLAADASDISDVSLSAPFRALVQKVNKLSDADTDLYATNYTQSLAGMFMNFSTNWRDENFVLGTDYKRELATEIDGVPARLQEVFQATQLAGCKREGVRQCVMLKLRREYGPAETARIQAELRLRGSKRQFADGRYLASVQFEPDGMIPHLFMLQDVEYGNSPTTALRVNVFHHPEAAPGGTRGGATPEGGGTAKGPSLPGTIRIPAEMNATSGHLSELRAEARPLLMKGAGPESAPVPPPAGAQEMLYSSGALQLRGWLAKPNTPTAAPAVVYLHDGFSPSHADWAAASEFLSKGFAVFLPQFRGEAGNPGDFSAFFNEVDDVIAAGTASAGLPGVDPKRVYLVGRGNGAALALLAAELAGPFAAVAALAPVDTTRLAFQRPMEMPFDTSDIQELTLRDPLQFPGDLQLRTLILTPDAAPLSDAFCAKAASGRCRVARLGGTPAADAQAVIAAWQ